MARPRAWGDTHLSLALLDGVVQEKDLLVNLASSDTRTVVRLIGRLNAQPNSISGQVDGSMVLSIGIGVVAAEAFAVQGTAMPNPSIVTEQPARGWLYKSTMVVTKEHASGTENEYTFIDTLAFDVRAARKIDRGVLFFSIESNNATGATAFDVRLSGVIRALCLS